MSDINCFLNRVLGGTISNGFDSIVICLRSAKVIPARDRRRSVYGSRYFIVERDGSIETDLS